MIFVGIAILIVLFISTNTVEKSLKSIEVQNQVIIDLLKEQNNK